MYGYILAGCIGFSFVVAVIHITVHLRVLNNEYESKRKELDKLIEECFPETEDDQA